MQTRTPDTRPRDRFLIGAGGGLIPFALNLLAVEGETLFADVSGIAMTGYAAQAILLATLGGFVAWMHDGIKEKVVLAQLGVAAPAFLKGLMSAGGTFALGLQISVATPVRAAEPPTQQAARFEVPRETATQQFFRGLLGVKGQLREYIVEVYHDADRARTEGRLRELQAAYPRFDFRLFAPTAGIVDEWVVTIEGQLTESEARLLYQEARERGVPHARMQSIRP